MSESAKQKINSSEKTMSQRVEGVYVEMTKR